MSRYIDLDHIKPGLLTLAIPMYVLADVALTKYDVVYISDQSGAYPKVTQADADTYVAGASPLYLAENGASADGDELSVIRFKVLDNFDTSAAALGDVVWLSSTAGGVTLTQPAPGKAAVPVGYVHQVAAAAEGVYTWVFDPVGASLRPYTRGQDDGDVLQAKAETVTMRSEAGVTTKAFTPLYKCRVIPVGCMMIGAGAAGDTVKMTDGTNDISDTVDVSAKSDKAVFDFGTWDDAHYVLNAGESLTMVTASDALVHATFLIMPTA
jgi:hypothetical protein